MSKIPGKEETELSIVKDKTIDADAETSQSDLSVTRSDLSTSVSNVELSSNTSNEVSDLNLSDLPVKAALNSKEGVVDKESGDLDMSYPDSRAGLSPYTDSDDFNAARQDKISHSQICSKSVPKLNPPAVRNYEIGLRIGRSTSPWKRIMSKMKENIFDELHSETDYSNMSYVSHYISYDIDDNLIEELNVLSNLFEKMTIGKQNSTKIRKIFNTKTWCSAVKIEASKPGEHSVILTHKEYLEYLRKTKEILM